MLLVSPVVISLGRRATEPQLSLRPSNIASAAKDTPLGSGSHAKAKHVVQNTFYSQHFTAIKPSEQFCRDTSNEPSLPEVRPAVAAPPG